MYIYDRIDTSNISKIKIYKKEKNMATKKITKVGTTEIAINSKSADTVYEFASKDVALYSLLDFTTDGGYTYLARKGNDLILVSRFLSPKGTTACYTTVKDYYIYAVNYSKNTVAYDGNSAATVYSEASNYDIAKLKEGYYQDTAEDDSILGAKDNNYYDVKNGTVTDGGNSISDYGGNDVYSLTTPTPTEKTFVNDYAGNDTYSVRATTVTIDDEKGNDKFKISDDSIANIGKWYGNDTYDVQNSKVVINDSLGNDKYTGFYVAADSTIFDYEGNDTYTFSKSSFSSLNDMEGNDTYNLAATTITGSMGDQYGNDKYNLALVTGTLYDEYGNDTYNINLCDTLRIENGDAINFDKKSGNDKYTVANSNQVDISDYAGNETFDVSFSTNVRLGDSLGNDTYKLNYVHNNIGGPSILDYDGNDKYELTFTSGVNGTELEIQDELGNDTYTFNDSDYIWVEDNGEGNDKYNISSYSQGIYVDDDGGKDTYTFSDSKLIGVYDDGTDNDTYTLTNVDNSDDMANYNLDDEGGNDKYTIKNSRGIDINDCIVSDQGKDSYTITDSDTILISDNGGNDTYTVTKTKTVSITDDEGNDTYTLTEVDNSYDYNAYFITDDEGNDKYTLKNSNSIGIKESDGDDTYTFTNSEKIGVNDVLGNDIYNLTNVDNSNNSADFYFDDKNGSDKYTFKNCNTLRVVDGDTISANVDIYNVTDSEFINVRDDGGKNTFNIKNVKGAAGDLAKFDAKGESTFNLSNSSYTHISGWNNLSTSNKYVVNNCKNVRVEGYQTLTHDTYTLSNIENTDKSQYFVYDKGGDDNYTVKNSSNLYIHDYTGNDTYTIDNFKKNIMLNDEGGYDTVTISGLNAKNVVVMANFTDTGSDEVQNGNLYVLDRTQKSGFMVIKNYFKTKFSGPNLVIDTANRGSGFIENLYAGKTELSEEIMDVVAQADLDDVGYDIAGWLLDAGHPYDSVEAVFESGNADDISSFITKVVNVYDNRIMA